MLSSNRAGESRISSVTAPPLKNWPTSLPEQGGVGLEKKRHLIEEVLELVRQIELTLAVGWVVQPSRRSVGICGACIATGES